MRHANIRTNHLNGDDDFSNTTIDDLSVDDRDGDSGSGILGTSSYIFYL
jgi:hypothetical protein